MKKTSLSIISLLVAVSLAFLTGCGESAQEQRRTRLIANQNLELKNLVEVRDKQIKELTALLEDCRKERNDAISKSGETATELLNMIAATTAQLEQFRLENEQLKEQIKQLQSQLDKPSGQAEKTDLSTP